MQSENTQAMKQHGSRFKDAKSAKDKNEDFNEDEQHEMSIQDLKHLNLQHPMSKVPAVKKE